MAAKGPVRDRTLGAWLEPLSGLERRLARADRPALQPVQCRILQLSGQPVVAEHAARRMSHGG